MTPPLWFMNDQSFRVHNFQPTSMIQGMKAKIAAHGMPAQAIGDVKAVETLQEIMGLDAPVEFDVSLLQQMTETMRSMKEVDKQRLESMLSPLRDSNINE